MMLVLLAAIDEGLASAFMGHPAQKRFLGELPGLPEEVVPIGLALIGKPGDAPLPGSRMKERRRADEALIHHNGWGGAPPGGGRGAGRVPRAPRVDERGEPLGDRGVFDLEDVLRVLLAAAREV